MRRTKQPRFTTAYHLPIMALGIDVGAAAIVTALDGEALRQRGAILSVEHSELAEQFLEPEDTLSARVGDRMYALGDAAEEFSGIVDESPERFVRNGRPTAPADDVPELIEAILTFQEGWEDGPLGYVSYPRASAVDDAIEKAADSLDLECRPVGPGVGMTYAVDEPTTLAVVIGATITTATLVVEGVPLAQATIDRGTDWIEAQYAEATGRDPETVVIERAETTLDDSGALTLQYDALFNALAAEITGPDWIAPGEPVSVLVGGAAPEGVADRVDETFTEAKSPFPIDDVRRVDNPVTAPARGARSAARIEPGERHAEAAPVPYAPGRTDEEAFEHTLETATAATAADPGVGADGSGGTIGDDSASAGGLSATGESGASAADGSDSHVTGASAGGVVDETLRTDLEALADDVETLTNRVATLRTDVDTVSETLPESNLADTLDTLEASIHEIETGAADADAVTELESTLEELEALEADVENLESGSVEPEELESIREQLDELEGVRETLDELEEDISTVEEELSTQGSNIDVFTDRLETVDERTETLDERIESLDEELAKLTDEELEALQSTVEDVESSVDTLEDVTVPEIDDDALGSVRERTDELESRLDSVWDRFETRIEELEDRIVGVQDDIVDASERIDGVEDGLANVDDRVSDVDDRIDEIETVDDRVETIDQQVTAVDDRIDRIDGQLAERIETVSETATDAEVRTADLGERVESIATTVGELRADLDAIDTDTETSPSEGVDPRIDEIETSLGAVEDAVAQLERELEEVASFEARLEEVETLRDRIDRLDETVRSGPDADAVDQLRDEFTLLSERVDTLSEEATAPNAGEGVEWGRVRDLRADLDAVEDEIESIHEELGTITELERRLDRIDDLQEDVAALQELRAEVDDVTDSVADLRDGSAERRAMLAQSAGLVALGAVGAAFAFQAGQPVLAPVFVAVPLLVSVIVWRLL